MLISQDDLLENKERLDQKNDRSNNVKFSPQRHPPFPCIFSRKSVSIKLFKFYLFIMLMIIMTLMPC